MLLKILRYVRRLSYFSLFVLTGCATNYGSVTPSDVSKAIVIHDSNFDEKSTYIGPQVLSTTRRGLFTDNETVRLVASRDKKTGKISYAVYVMVIYPIEWRFYRTVSFSNGIQQDLKSIGQKSQACGGIGCVLTEEIAFSVEKNIISSGDFFEFRLNSKNGTQNIIKIPRSYIEGFFNGLPSDFRY